ncbi:hypothetical protein [Sphaerisporangium perillae]|uniref:hypothetical protein n=1 Tax=Sphaerisporangium perillae TaxID=2935860 RepID=UPI00200F4875|nr:hypothetical protein [Sphaerisporangium perillae]
MTTVILGTSLTADVAFAARAVPAAHNAAGKAVNLKLTETIRRRLADAYWRKSGNVDRSKVDGPSSVYYGKIKGATPAKDVYWALGQIGIKGDPISYQDGPHVWRKRGKGAWSYLGDTGGCPDRVPRAMLKIWHLSPCG